MRLRVLLTTLIGLLLAILLVAPALAGEGGEGLYGKTNDKVITNFGFGLMIFFTALVISLSAIQRLLEKRKKPK
jgi:hypothetical protein